LSEVLAEKPSASVALNGLLSGHREKVLSDARRMREAGYTAVKLKVGSNSVREDVEAAGEVAEVLSAEVSLRFDANRAWSYEEAAEFCLSEVGSKCEYVEEPLVEPADLSRLVDEYGARVALDESLVDMQPEELRDHRYAQAVVLKPTLLGGLSRTLEFADVARRMGLAPVISSAYETGVGTAALVSLAAATGGGIPAGLDTYRRLAADVYEEPLDLSTSVLNVREVTSVRALDLRRLERVCSWEA
jgi:O-succinylbenzoate synthase